MESSARKILSPLRSEPRCALPSVGSANRHFTENNSARDFPKFFPSLKISPALQRVGYLTLRGEFFEGKNFVKFYKLVAIDFWVTKRTESPLPRAYTRKKNLFFRQCMWINFSHSIAKFLRRINFSKLKPGILHNYSRTIPKTKIIFLVS